MKSNIHLATVLANLCWARSFPLSGGAHSVIHIPQALFTAAVTDPCLAAGTPRREETASSSACFDWPFPRQDLLFVMILQCPLTESSSDLGSIGKEPVAHCCPLPNMKTTELHFQRSSLPTHRYQVPLEHQGWVMVPCILVAPSSLFFLALG